MIPNPGENQETNHGKVGKNYTNRERRKQEEKDSLDKRFQQTAKVLKKLNSNKQKPKPRSLRSWKLCKWD